MRATLRSIEVDVNADHWLQVGGKCSKARKAVLPEMARGILEGYLSSQGLPVTPAKWNPATPLVGTLEGEAGITAKRLWAVLKRYFATAADVFSDAILALMFIQAKGANGRSRRPASAPRCRGRDVTQEFNTAGQLSTTRPRHPITVCRRCSTSS